MNKESPVYIVAFMIIICVVSSFAIAFIYYASLDMLKANEALHVNRVLARAFDLPKEEIEKSLEKFNLDYNGRAINAFRNKTNNDVGFIWSGSGFWDTIKGVIVFSGNLDELKSVQILEQKETPGLGARIEEKWYTDQFRGIKIDWKSPKDKRIGASSVDAITGATQTSIAVISILNKEIEIFKAAYKR